MKKRTHSKDGKSYSSARMSLTIECLLSRATFLSRGNNKKVVISHSFVFFIEIAIAIVVVMLKSSLFAVKKFFFFEYFRAYSLARAEKEKKNTIKRSCTRREKERERVNAYDQLD